MWVALGYRSRKFVTFFLEEGAKLEEGAEVGCQVCKRSLEARDKFWFPFLGSYNILRFTPLAFSAFYLILFIVSVLP